MNTTQSLLSPFLGDFERALQEREYRTRTIDQYLAKCRTFDTFLVQRSIGLDSLTQSTVEDFLDEKLLQRRHRDEAEARRSWCRPLQLLVEHLRHDGVISPSPTRGSSDPMLLLEYASFLNDHRGLCERTVEDQKRHLRRFFDHVGATHETDLLTHISLEQVDGFLVDLSRRLGRVSINAACSALRGFLRYLHMRGLLRAALAEQVTRPRLYSLASVPRAIDWRDVERTLALVDRATLCGCRDYAILVLLAYYGLRAGEVAGLRLENIDWSHDTLRVQRPKCKTVDHLPLISLVGEALIAYLRRRPSAPYPQVFLKVLAPAGPLNRPCITCIARKYLLRAEVKLPHLGAHTLRHSYAVRLLRQGFPLKTIGDALGHQHLQSTFIYTKAAVEDLCGVSLEITELLP
jgi:site-specific recombinase XerD